MAVIGMVTTALLAGAWKGAILLAIVVAVCGLLAWVSLSVLHGDCDVALMGWVLLFPLGYYCLSYPRDRPVIQFDRILIVVLIGCLLATPRDRLIPASKDMKDVGVAWGAFLVVTLMSLVQAANVLTVGRLIVDTFAIPMVLGWYVLRRFRVDAHAKWLHGIVCIASVYSAVIGVAEVILQRDLLPFESSGILLAYDSTDPLSFIYLRPNGPFSTANSYALIGLITLFFLGALWRITRENAGRVRRIVHVCGCSAAMVQSLLPLFRSVLLTLLIVAILDILWTSGLQRIARIVGVVLLLLFVVGMATMAPGVFHNRSNPDNIYARIIQQRQTFAIVMDHPILGVGLMNFTTVAESNPRYNPRSMNGIESEEPSAQQRDCHSCGNRNCWSPSVCSLSNPAGACVRSPETI